MATCTVCGEGLPAGSRFCPACGTPTDSSTATTERKLVSILFADLVGSTAFASGEDPERVRAVLDSFYDAMAEEAVAAGGTVEKFAGDAVLAAFGATTAQEDHAERALHAALAMQRRFAELFGEQLGLRVGVNTGEVAVGPARVGGSFISGDAVNVAARLEQAAPPGEILVSERTVAAVRDAFEFGEPDTIVAKGKDEGVACRQLVRAMAVQRSRGVAGRQAPFVGRDGELDVLRANAHRAIAQGEPHLVTIVGEPGVGKTRLASELWRLLAASSDDQPVLRIGRCLSYGDGITYWPLAEVLRQDFGLPEGTPAADVAARLGEEGVLGLALGLDVLPHSHPLEAREKLHAAFVSFFERMSREHPAVVVVEDMHWAEDDLLDLLDRIVREAHGPLLVLTTSRPELFDRRSHWGSGHRNTSTIWLEPLRADETARLVDGLLSQELPAELRALLVERTEGNPFFVEELVGTLLDEGILDRSAAGTAGDLSDLLRVPDSVHAVLAARIDRLPAAGKATLQAASVVGRVFWPEAVAHLLGIDEMNLEVLEERDFARRVRGAGQEVEYAMKHALTRDVAYASIPKARRGRLHAALGGWLEGRPGSPDEHAPLLAYHYSEAARPEDADLVWGDDPDLLADVRRRAVRWLSRAGTLARGRHEILEAVELFTRAVHLSDDEHERALLWRAIGAAQALRYDGEAMRSALLRALDGPLDDEERADTYALLAFQASLRSSMWSIRLNRSLIEDWAGRAIELARPASGTRLRAMLALANVEPGSTSPAELDQATSLAEGIGDLQLRSYALGSRSVAAFEVRRFAEAAEWADRRLALLDGIDDPDHLCEAYESTSPVFAAVGRFDEVRHLDGLHAELSRRLSPHHRVHAVSLELELADALGDWEAIVRETDRVWEVVSTNLATPCVRNPRDLLLCAAAHVLLGDEARAVELERDAANIGGTGYDSYLAGPRFRMALARRDRNTLQDLVELPVERGFVWGAGALASRLDALTALGLASLVEAEASILLQEGTVLEPFALRALGAVRRDGDLLAKADECFAALGLEWHRAQTERLLAGL
ncbi:MAG: adenylate/guanylate cyclase domain-containing protein [Gaiellaceae bacterium]